MKENLSHMSSKLDPFFSKIFELLNEQGLSYQSTCSFLEIQGVKISPQALRSWYLRRNRKLMVRAKLSHRQQDFDLGKAVLETGRVAKSIEAKSLLSDALTNGGVAGINAQKMLEEQIQREEISLTSGMPFGQKGFLIKKKETSSANPESERKASIA